MPLASYYRWYRKYFQQALIKTCLNMNNSYKDHRYTAISGEGASEIYARVYPKVSGLASWSENCKW
jgi:hypothetical protein